MRQRLKNDIGKLGKSETASLIAQLAFLYGTLESKDPQIQFVTTCGFWFSTIVLCLTLLLRKPRRR